MKKKAKESNLVLTGLMGSGKSSVGRTLARLLKRRFIDTDVLIEKREGKTIPNIFKSKGEEYFRQLEKKVLAEVLERERSAVVSLGGGTVVDDENRALAKRHGVLIALIAEPEELYERVKRRKSRPLLNQSEDPLQTLRDLWEARKPAYMDSCLQIKTEGKEIDMIAEELIQALSLEKPNFHEILVEIDERSKKYPIRFNTLGKIKLRDLNIGRKILVVTQEPIAKHYLDTVVHRLEANYEVFTLQIENGESAKNFFTYQNILQKLLELNFERKDSVLALGGGVVGDIVGFAASTYYRGINYLQVPTTLLSMIDSSVGGKTAINVPQGKNLIGTFYQPHIVYVDVESLRTLPSSELKSGLGELVKYTMLGGEWDYLIGESFYSFVSRNASKIVELDETILRDTIEHCLKIKANIVTQDEKEKGLRMHLNLGHTFGHAIEEVTKYERFSHGEAVAMGIVCACYAAEELNYFKSGNTEKILSLMDALGLSYKIPADIETDAMIEAFAYDKKSEAGKAKFILPKGKIGRVVIEHGLDVNLVRAAIDRNR